MPSIDTDAPGKSLLLMGNEAIARGALEGGLGFAAAYPGTPSTEILERLAGVAKKMGIYAEWSTNEMVAMEAAAGASFGGIRAMASMKTNGAYVAADFLSNLVVSGIGAGLLLVVSDDPPTLSSATQGDMKKFAEYFGMPALEPGDFQDAKDMAKYGLELSEELETICLLRSSIRISHCRGAVRLGELPKKPKEAFCDCAYDIRHPEIVRYTKNPKEKKRGELADKLEKARAMFETSPFNVYVGPAKAELLIATCGPCWLHCQEAVKTLKLEARVGIMKIGTVWPLPEKFITDCLKKSDRLLVVEEPDPFLERQLRAIIADLPAQGSRPTLFGKRSGHISLYGEQNSDSVTKAVAGLVNLRYLPRPAEYDQLYNKLMKDSNITIPVRIRSFCAGCPHRASWWAIKNALRLDGRSGVVNGDVGCYSMAENPTGFYQQRTNFGMGSGPGVANGLGQLARYGMKQPVMSVVGDSTFFHACIPALVNGIFNKSNFVFAVMDNSATAMTGFQPHPGTGKTAMGDPTNQISIEALCRSLGCRVEVVDPFDLAGTTNTILDLLRDEEAGGRVLIFRRECALLRARHAGPAYQVRVETTKCLGETCGCDRVCSRVFACPGLTWDVKTGKARIDEVQCDGCGVCVDVCPQGAIVKEAMLQ